MAAHEFNFAGANPVFHINSSANKVGKVVGAKALNANVLVELYTPQEAMGTSLSLSDNANDAGAPQGRLLDIGPALDPKCGLKVGQRVLLQGTSVPLPRMKEGERKKVIVEAHCVKAVLLEEGD